MIVVEPLLKKPEAARMLGMSESWLEKQTAEGNVPCVRLGRAVRYDVADLRAMIESKKINTGAGALDSGEVCSAIEGE